MSRFARLCGAAAMVAIIPATQVNSAASDQDIPNFSFITSGWLLNGGIDFHPIPGAVPPISFDPAYPQKGEGNQRGVMERMSDAENANLKPWAKELMRKYNQDVLDGHRAFSSQSRCWPGGTPGQLLFPAEPIFFIQTPKEVWMVWQRDHVVRRIFLDRPHSQNIKPSWFGESVGHYENGDTLVVDTIGLSTYKSYIDNFRTPHTEQEHVVERFTIAPDGKSMTAVARVEDPGAYNAPITMKEFWFKANQPMLETVCPENNEDFFHQNLYAIPEAKTADF